MISAGRGIVAGIVVVAFVLSTVVGGFPAGLESPTIVATARTQLGGPDPSTLFPLPRSPLVLLANGLARTPPMGWNGYNHFWIGVTAATVKAAARALVTSGMKAAGYNYVNLDGGWDLRRRSAGGAIQPDPAKFPQGIRPVADYVHSLGLKFGIYTSAGLANCAGTSAGSYRHFQQDATTFASWGVDYLKLDWCYIPYRDYPHMTQRQVSQMLATSMGIALASTGRAILYDVNDWGNDERWSSAQGLANLWRTTPDIQDRYRSMLWNFTHNVSHFERARPGGWNDPDMLEIGNGGMSITEYRSQFSLWAEMAAPLIAGNDLTAMSAMTRSILTNPGVIEVDQDPLGRQGYPVASADGHWVLTKPLMNGGRAVVLFNQTDTPATISTTLTQVGLANASEHTVLDLWSGAVTETSGEISATVPPHGVVFYEIAKSATQEVTA